MGVKIVTSVDNIGKLAKAMNFMMENEVYVGISDETTTREKGEPVTNAELLHIHSNGAKIKRKRKSSANDLYIFSNGSPIFEIPARPVIEPAIKDDKDNIAKYMDAAFSSALKGNMDEALRKLKIAGTRAEKVCRLWFTNPKNGWAPNSPSVEARKKAKGSTDPKPLIDTGELRKSITYFVKRRIGGKVK